jgi:hypothetical protein
MNFNSKETVLRTSIWISVLFILLSSLTLVGSSEAAAGGSVAGTIYVRNYLGDYRAAGWANVTATDGVSVIRAHSESDGRYFMFLPTGNWRVTASMPGYDEVTKVVAVSDGSATSYDFYLQQSGVPIPEFHEYATMFITSISLVLVIVLMRRKRSLPLQLNRDYA